MKYWDSYVLRLQVWCYGEVVLMSTTVIGAGTGRLALIKIAGKNEQVQVSDGDIKITDAYVPVNATTFKVAVNFSGRDVINTITIRRPSTQKWINILGAEIFGGGISALGWKPGDRDLFFDRTITKLDGNTITIDAPITTALDSNLRWWVCNFLQ